ncbi:MFS transporter [Actinocorallia aurea]
MLPVLLIGAFIPVLDFFIVNVALPDIQRDLHAGSAATQWIVAGYGLAYGSGLILGARLGDLAGRRRMFALGLTLFTVASAACGLAPTSGGLVAARVAQGVAAAVLAPQVLAIVRAAYTGAALAKAMRAYALVLGLAAVFGQLVGGSIIGLDPFGLGWRGCFLVNVPIGIAVLVLAPRLVPESRADGPVRLDLGGAGLVTLGVAAFLLPLIQGREQGWPLWIWASFAVAALALLGYARRRHPAPLISPELFGVRPFMTGLAAQVVFNIGMTGHFLAFALYIQRGRDFDAFHAGLAFVPIGLGYFAGSLLAGRLAGRFGSQVIAFGGLTRTAGLACLLALTAAEAPYGALAPVLLLDGLGMGLAFGPLAATVLAAVGPRHAGSAAGVLTSAQQIGGAMGVALIGLVFFTARGSTTTAFDHSLAAVMAATLLLALLVQLLPRTPRAS